MFVDFIMDCYLYQHITDPTRIRVGQYSNAPELMLTNEEHLMQNLQIEPPLRMSDHVGLVLIILCITS